MKRRTQFAVKAGVVLLLSLLFGVAMPLLLEGTRILPEYKLDFAWDLMHGKLPRPVSGDNSH